MTVRTDPDPEHAAPHQRSSVDRPVVDHSAGAKARRRAGPRPPIRVVIAVVACAATFVALLLAYAAPRIGVPWSGESIPLPPAQFSAVAGNAVLDGDTLRLQGRISEGRAAVAAPVSLDAGSYRFFDYAFTGFPPSLRLQLGWRSAAQPKRWQWAALPQPPPSGAPVTVDLARLLPAWDGEIDAVGFAIAAAEFLPAGAVPPHDLALTAARLRGDGRAAALAALWDEWMLYRPWSGRSINTGGFDLRYDAPRPWSGFVLGVGVVLLLVAGLALGWRRRGWSRAAVVATCLAWLLLDAAQLRMASLRTAHVHSLAELAPEGLRTEPGIAAAMDATRNRIATGEGGGPKVVVLGGSPFLLAYPPYELLPLNVAGSPQARLADAPAGTLVLRLGNVGTHDADAGTLVLEEQDLPVRLLHAQPGIQLLELGDRGEGGE